MATSYQLSHAKRDFAMGYLKKYRIERAPMTDGWMIHLGENETAGWLCDQVKKQTRVFKTLDGAVATVEAIGFKVMVIAA